MRTVWERFIGDSSVSIERTTSSSTGARLWMLLFLRGRTRAFGPQMAYVALASSGRRPLGISVFARNRFYGWNAARSNELSGA